MPLKAAIIPVTPFQQNCSLVWDDETMKGALVDPGGDLDRLEAALQETGVELEKILLTHGHLDHAAAAGKLAADHSVPIEGPHEDDRFLIEGLPDQSEKYGLPVFPGFAPNRWLRQGDTVSVGGLTFDVIHCPGHTPGHVVFYHAPSKLAIVGDVLFQGSIGRTDLPRGNFQDLIDSITQRLWPLGGDVSFIPGHGPMSTFKRERQMNPFVSDLALSMS